MMRKFLNRAMVAVWALAGAGSLAAATYTWTGEGAATDGVRAWNDAANWGGVACPGAGDTAQLSTDDGTVSIPSGGVTVARIYAPGGAWRFTGGTLTLSDAAPFSSGTTTYDQRAALLTFDCPVNFSATADKTVLSGNTFNNSVTLGTSGRAFFMKGDTAGASGLTVFSGARTYDFSGNNNICCGKNDGNTAHGGEMYIQDGATVKAKIFFDFAGSTTTVSNGTLITTAGGTGQSIDMTHAAVLNVLAGGTVNCAGRLTIGQSTSIGGNPTLNVQGGTVTANYLTMQSSGLPTLVIDDGGTVTVAGNFDFKSGSVGTPLKIGKGSLTVGGTMTQGGSQQMHFYVPADQRLGTVTAGTMKHTSAQNTVNIYIHDDTLANGTTYTLVTDQSKTLTLADYTVTYNGFAAAEKGALKITDGVLTFQPTATAVVWTGAGDGVKFSDGANWSTGTAPTNGASLYFSPAAGGSLVNDLDGLAAEMVQFTADAGAYTIGGNALVVRASVVNRSAAEQTFACAVSAPDGQTLSTDYSTAAVVYAGGLVCLDLVGANDLSRTLKGGPFTFTKTQPAGDNDNDAWSTVTYTVAAGATLNVPGELFVRNGYGNPKFVIEEGATMNVGTYRCRAAFETFDVKGTLNADLIWGWGYTPVFTTSTSTGTVNAGGVRISANNPHQLRAKRFNIGAAGITGIVGAMVASDIRYAVLADGVTLGATADWSLSMTETIAAFKLDVPGASTLDTDGHVVTLRAPLTGDGTLTLTDDSILDVSAGEVSVRLAPQAGATIRTTPGLTKTLPLQVPAEGQINVELLSSDGLPKGVTLTVFKETGLTAADAAAFKVTVPGHDDVKGEVAITDGTLVFTVTESATAAAALTWRPTTDEEAAGWSTALTSWYNETTGLRTAFASFSDATFDGQEETYTDGVITLPADVSLGKLSVGGDRDYTFTGTGRLIGKDAVTKSGAGTWTLNVALTEQPDLTVTGGTLKLGADLPQNGLGTAGTNGTVTVAAGGQIDLNYALTTANDAARTSLLTDRLVTLAGAGPDGEGAIVNNGGSSTWYAALARVRLAGDTTFGGNARIDFRAGANYGTTYTDRPFIAGGDYTLTSKVAPTNNTAYGLHLRNTDVSVGKLVVAPGAHLGSEADTVIAAPGGVVLEDGAVFDIYGGSVGGGAAQTVLAPAAGASATVRNVTGTLAFNLDAAVPAEATLTVRDNTIDLNGSVDNAGTVNFAGGTQNLLGALRGTGLWTVSGGLARLRTAGVPETMTWTIANGAGLEPRAEFQAPETALSLAGDGYLNWGSYDTNAAPVAKSLTLTGNVAFRTQLAVSQTLPPVEVVCTNNLCGQYTDNLTSHTKFTEGSISAREFFVGGSSRGGHFSSYAGTTIAADLFHVGNQSYTAPRAIYSLEGGTVALGERGLRSQYAPPGTFMFFNSGTLRMDADATTGWGLCSVFGRDDDSAPLKLDVADHTLVYRGGLGGKTTVGTAGTGSFLATDPNGNEDLVQDFAEGRWIARAATNDFSGASAFGAGLEVAAGVVARVDIAGEDLCEFTHYGTTGWETLLAARNAAWQIANNMNHLHLKLDNTVKPYDNQSFVYRGQFYVAEEGSWTFAGTYDDRLGLAIDGKEVLKTTGSGDVKCASIALTAGWHDYFIVVEDGTGTQGPTAWTDMGLGWTNAVVSSTAQTDYRKFAIGEPGLKFRLANAVQWERREMTRLEDMSGIPQVGDFETIEVTNSLRAISSTTWPEGKMALNRFTGSFYVPAEQAGQWLFTSDYDDYVTLKVDGADSGMNGRTDGVQKMATPYQLEEGWHAFEIRVYDRGGGWGPRTAAAALLVTIAAGDGVTYDNLAFDERNFRFTRLSKPARAGLAGTVAVDAAATLENKAAGACPIWGVVEGTGTLAGSFAFQKGSTLRLSGGGKTLAGVAFAANASGTEPSATTLADLGAIDITLSARAVLPKYDVAPALGLTAETAADLPVTATGLGHERSHFSATVENGRLVILNSNPGGLTVIIR